MKNLPQVCQKPTHRQVHLSLSELVPDRPLGTADIFCYAAPALSWARTSAGGRKSRMEAKPGPRQAPPGPARPHPPTPALIGRPCELHSTPSRPAATERLHDRAARPSMGSAHWRSRRPSKRCKKLLNTSQHPTTLALSTCLQLRICSVIWPKGIQGIEVFLSHFLRRAN